MNKTKYTLIILFLALSPFTGDAVEIEYGLPDSLQDLNFWGNDGEFVGAKVAPLCPDIPLIVVTPESGLVDSLNVYTIDITLPQGEISKLGGVAFGFPTGFDLDHIEDIIYSDDYEGEDLELRRAYVFGSAIVIFFKWGLSPPGGTVITLEFISIKNPTVAGLYRIAGLTFNKWFRVEAGPNLSESFMIYPDRPVSLELVPDSDITLKAGHNQLFEAIAVDRFGNVISDLEFQWSLSRDYDMIGILSGGNLFATTVGVGKVVAEYYELSAESGLITVTPGGLSRFEIHEYPSMVDAGMEFPSPVEVTVYDAFGNIKTDYTGSVFFTSSDPQAVIFHNAENPYLFNEADAGKHVFDGSGFVFGTPGQQTLLITDGEIIGTSGTILVRGGAAVSFELEYPDDVVAGQPLNLKVINAKDINGNAASGLVNISIVGEGVSPGGFEPILNEIYVIDGAGSADQYLFKTGSTVLKASIDGQEREAVFGVLPAELANLRFEITETQFFGNSLMGPASITAIDKYGNIKSDFDASQSPVALNVNHGELIPNILDGAADFVEGIADLASKNIVYYGPTGGNFVSCVSGNIISGQASVIFNGIVIQPYSSFPEEIIIGRLIGFGAYAVNDGSLAPLEPVVYTSYFASCFEPCAYSRPLRTILPGEVERFTVNLDTRELEMIPEDTIIIIMESSYLHEGDTITVITRVVSPVRIRQELITEYVEHSLSIDSVLSPSTLDSFSFEIRLPDGIDFSEANFRLNVQMASDQNWHTIFPQRDEYTLEGNILTAQFYDVGIWDFSVFDDRPEGYRDLLFEGYVNLPDTSYIIPPVENFDSLYVVYPSEVSYQAGSLSPTIVGAGAGQSFELDVVLDGLSTFRLDPCLSRLSMNYNGVFIGDACLLESYLLVPGINHLVTREIYIPDSLINADLTPYLVLGGIEINEPRTDSLVIEGETIQVADLPRVKIASADLITFNPPYVNHEQVFSIRVGVTNLSETDIENTSVYIKSEDGLTTFAEAHGTSLPASLTTELELDLTAPAFSMPIMIYKAEVQSNGIAVLPPEDNTVAVVVQSPAQIVLNYAIPNAYDGVVDIEQMFTVDAKLENAGEARAGAGEVSLIAGGIDFGIPDSSALTVEIDSVASFEMTAPSNPVEAEMRLKITGPPIDANTGQPALIMSGSETIAIKVESGFTELVVDGVASQSPLIIEGATRELFRLELLNNTENSINVVGMRSIIIRITDRNGFLISPDLILSAEDCGFYSDDVRIAVGEVDNNLLRVNFTGYELYPGVMDTIFFRARFNDEIDIGGFSMSIDSRDIRAVFITGPRINQTVPVRGTLSDSFRIGGNFAVTVPGLGNSLTVRNNPFNPKEGPAEIAYILEQDTDVELTVYTLTGEKVYEKMMRAGTNGGVEGQNYVDWDGTNDEGKMVLNGVYIFVFKPDYSDESVKIKVAVMK